MNLKDKSSTSNSEDTRKHNQYLFSIDFQRNLLISSNFQNGNINLVKRVNQLNYILEAVSDMEGVQSRKCWFHFKIKSEKGIRVHLQIQNVSIYETIYEERSYCKPVMKQGKSGQWRDTSQAFFSYRDELSLIIEHTFKNSQEVYFALSIPFTYSDNQNYIAELKQKIHPQINFKDEILATTPKGKLVHLLTITEKSQETNRKQVQDFKPIILITCRVHPGEVSSSFCLQGIIQFILTYHSLQAYLLRRLFVFKIVPMLNPDGVVEGNYRCDPLGFNLNRFYLQPNKQLHPAIYQLQLLMKKTLATKQKIQYYFDLHSHSSIKESFIYGNALDDIVSQTYSQMFCKVLEENYPRFRYFFSNFGEVHMKHKDRGEAMTKEGCGRVVVSKMYGVVCSYTMESSIFPASYQAFIHKTTKNQPKNKQFFLPLPNQSDFGFSPIYRPQNPQQNILIAQNKRLGGSMMTSVLDMLAKNPYPRLINQFTSTFCKQVSAKLLQNEERFKMMDIKAHQKTKNIIENIKIKFQETINKEWIKAKLHLDINPNIWPPQFKIIAIPTDTFNKTNSKKIITRQRHRTEGIQQIKKSKNSIKIFGDQSNKGDYESQRQISPNKILPIKSFFPEIKYSAELKIHQKKQILTLSKSNSIKETTIRLGEQQGIKVPKKMIIDYINDEITKIPSDKQILKRTNQSLNRLMANRLIEKEKNKGRKSQLKDYKKIIIESRRRMATQCLEEFQHDKIQEYQKVEEVVTKNEEQLDLKKADIVKKKMLLTNKAIQILKKNNNDRTKVKLPEVNKVNLVIQNSIKDLKTHANQPTEYSNLL